MSLNDSHSDRFMEQFGSGKTELNENEKLDLKRQEMVIKYNQQVLEDTLEENATRPVRVKQVNVIGTSDKFRDKYLARQLQPLLKKNDALTLEKFLKNIDKTTYNFTKTGTIQDIGMDFRWIQNKRNYDWPNALDIVANVSIKPVNKFFMKVGTNVGNGEGDGYVTLQWKNILGGGETLNLDTNITSNNIGARNKSQYLISYSSPIFNHPDFKFDSMVYHSSRVIDYTTYHEQIINGITNKISTNYLTFEEKFNHQLSFENLIRTIKLGYSPNNYRNNSLVNDYFLYNAGDSLKSSLTYTLSHDTRDNMILPKKGHYFQSSLEYSMLPGSRFIKNQFQFSQALSVTPSSILNLNLKSGLVKSFENDPIHPMDKFQLGGANDVRGFLISGLGPKQMGMSIGGDIFYSFGLSYFDKIPFVSKDSNFKLHYFLNGGNLRSLGKENKKNVIEMLKQPSLSAGFGIIYAHPAARFELNFGLPIHAHHGDDLRRGIQYGIGLSFL